MKTQSHQRSGSKPLAAFAMLLVTGLFLAGCVVTSVYPFYTEKDLVFEPSLLGDWAGTDKDPSPIKQFTRVERVGEKGYRATSFNEERTNSVICHLFRLKGQLFLDTCPTNHEVDLIPVHQVSKVTRLSPEFENANLNYKWLEELLKKNPKAIRHTIVNDKFEGTNDTRIVLTADTAELQKFILKYLNNTNAWNESTKASRPHKLN
jgi:hypothetical protein